MNPASLSEEEIFQTARHIDSAEARRAYLDRVCGADAPLRSHVEALLAAYEASESFLESPAFEFASEVPTRDQVVTERPGAVIGPFKLLQQIGEGGMGVVFMAEQLDPIHRTVALKIVKPGMDSRQVVARFAAERQALAMMDHPNIARVLDAGTTQSGRPYFVMELVKGVPITKYCDEKQLSIPARLELFRAVCQAVQHAHHKGIIHRDIKPTNVLVAEYDNHAVPKVIDFGVAKATAQKLTERTMFTEFGQVVGTVEYMSPEQAKFNQLDIDTRSDIYSLGVLLYELLTGTTPFERKRLQAAAFDEMLRIIREEEPPRPSTRLTTLAQQAASTVSTLRASDPERLSVLLRGELDWIVMKCLDKDRKGRYESANALAADIERYLGDEPVQACPPSLTYRLGKFVRRHKAALATTSLLAGVLISAMFGLVIATVLVWRANNESRLLAYFQRVALAEREWTANNLTRAEELLALCPTDLRGWEWHYVKRLRGTQPSPLRHENALWGSDVSPSGRQIAAVDFAGNVYCWDADTGQRTRVWHAAHDAGTYAAFDPDGQRIASSGWNDVKVWNAASGEQLGSWQAPRGQIQGLTYASDGRLLVCVCDQATENEMVDTQIWDAATGKQLFDLPDIKRLVQGIDVSPDGRILAVAGEDQTVRIVDSHTGEVRRTFRGDRKLRCVAFSPDGSLVAAGSGYEGEQGSGSVTIWDIATGRERSPLSRHGAYSLAFSPDGQRLATGGIDQAVKIWDVASAQEILTLRGHTDWVMSVAFSRDGHRLISASADRTIRIWDGRPWNATEKFGEDTVTLRGHADGVNAVAFHPTQPELATASTDGSVKIWDTQSWRELRTLHAGNREIGDLAYAPAGDLLAIVVAASHAVVLLDAVTGKESQRLAIEAPTCVAFSPTGRELAAGDGQGVVIVFEIAGGARVHRFQTPCRLVYAVHYSPDEQYVAAACVDGSVSIWNTATGLEVEARPMHQGVVEAVAFAPDGSLLASGGWDRSVRLWETVTWKRVETVIDATGAMHGIAFSPDSRYLAWGASDSTAKLWDRTSGQIQTLRGHFGWVRSVAFSPDGRFLASGSDDGTAKIWTLPRDETNP